MNITKAVEEYVNFSPSIKDCLKEEVINYSDLSRKIIKETQLKQKDFDAILVALRRYARKINGLPSFEKRIQNVLSKSKLTITNRVGVIVLEKHIYSDDLLALEKKIKKARDVFYAIEGTGVITIITAEYYLEEIKKTFKGNVIHDWDNLALIVISSPEDIEEIPGVYAHLATLLSQKGINVYETMSCWSETLFVVAENDVSRSISTFGFSKVV